MKRVVTASLLTAALSFVAVAHAQTTVPANEHQAPTNKQAQPNRGHLVEIRMDDDFKPKTRTAYGKLEGYDPVVVVVHRGDRVRFVNVDDIAHTATGYAFGGSTLPAHYTFQGDPSSVHGDAIAHTEWSTGSVAPHTRSKVFSVNTTGTFYFADAYHQAEMRGAIVVK